MGYTAWEKVRQLNQKRYGIDYPQQPEDYRSTKKLSNIETSSISFIRDLCEELRFDNSTAERERCEDSDGDSIKPGLIPFNMEKDTDRLCMERAIHRFMKSGKTEDAFDIYFCYLEMFVGKYGKSKKMIEMLAEFEMNASSLLLKHRDHYSHSVYVFLLGLSIYYNSSNFRKAYFEEYGFDGSDEKGAAHHFLQYWGLTALFHDIGYPFELPFEQVKSYFGDSIKGVPFIAYKGVDAYIEMELAETQAWAEALQKDHCCKTITELFAEGMADKLEEVYGIGAEEINKNLLMKKAGSPDEFNGFMDHAFFSGILLYHQLKDVIGIEKMTEDTGKAHSYLDAFTAITLHNSLFKFGITNIKKDHQPFLMKLHPMAYMLMLCDELQCWDRKSYGQNSRQQLHPMDCDLRFDGDNQLTAVYQYDKRYEAKKNFLEARKIYIKGTYHKMVSPSSAEPEFLADIKSIMQIDKDSVTLQIDTEFVENDRTKEIYLSESNYVHLYHFSIVLHYRNHYDLSKLGDKGFLEEAENSFNRLPMEYQMSGISRTKNYAKYLNAIGYFYSDRSLNYELIGEDGFSDGTGDNPVDEVSIIGEMEHERWNDEKLEMGWNYDTKYKEAGRRTDGASEQQVRELTRTHYEVNVKYDDLGESNEEEKIKEQKKDTEPLKKMIRMMEEYDGLRIYKIPGWKMGEK